MKKVVALFLALVGAVALAQIGGGGITGGGGGGGFSSGTAFTMHWGSGGSQACGSTADQTWKYYTSGSIVVLTPTAEMTCTGSSTFFISAPNDIPSAIRPNTSAALFLGIVRTQDTGAETAGCLWIETDFSMTIRKTQANGLCNAVGSGTWTASGVRSLFMTTNIGPNNFVYNTTRN